MVLNGQQFAEIVSYLRSKSAGPPPGSDKRRTSRMEIKSRIVITPIRDGAACPQASVLTRDISLEGVGLLAAVPLVKSQQFIALLPRNDRETFFVLCEVMFCGVVADGMFTLGCRFLKLIPAEAATKLQSSNEAAIARIRESVLK